MSNESLIYESKISEGLSKLSSLYSDYDSLIRYEQDNKIYFEQKEIDLKVDIKYYTLQVYNSTCTYLEAKGLIEYLKDFKGNIQPRIADDKLLYQAYYNDYVGELVSVTREQIIEHLTPFTFLDDDSYASYYHRAGVQMLEKILRSTERLLLHLNITPSSEAQIYNAIKPFIESTFVDTISPRSKFFTNFKEYIPDALVPDLQVAIEYKYAKVENDLKNQMDQIRVDERAYQGDSNYKLFYAVFYVTSDFWGIDKFLETWKQLGFPDNWIPIYIVGRPPATKKKTRKTSP